MVVVVVLMMVLTYFDGHVRVRVARVHTLRVCMPAAAAAAETLAQ